MQFKTRFYEVIARIRLFGADLVEYWFRSKQSYFTKWVGAAVLVALFVIGLGLWGNFLNWGKIDFNLGDWNIITGRRLTALQDALLTGQAPLHVSDFMGLKGLTDRYLAIPDMFLSPQAVLLRYLPLNIFVLVNTFWMYALGYCGLLAMKRKYHLSLAVFVILFFLFNFNGSITTHLVIGHFTWLGYFLLPFFALLLFDIPTTAGLQWGWLLKVSLLLTVIFIQGAFHLYIWCLVFLGFVFLLNRQYRRHAFWAILFALLLSMFRILPASLDAGKLSVEFLTGFPTSGDFLRGMLEVVQPSMDYTQPGNLVTHHIGWWEFDFYIGWVGLAFILVFGCWAWLKERKGIPSWVASLFGPMLVLFVFSMGRIYKPIFMLQIPLLTAERVTTRFWTLPLVFLFFLGAIGLQKFFNTRRVTVLPALVYVAALMVLTADLQRHLDLWNIAFMKLTLPRELGDYTLHILNNPADQAYLSAILIGSLLSLGALGFELMRYFRSRV